MQSILIAIGAITGVAFFWAMSAQRRLVVLDENINNAMSQIGVQLSCRFDTLTALLEITKGFARQESETLIETIKTARSDITAKSSPDDIQRQETAIAEALCGIVKLREQYPELKVNETFNKTMDAVQTYENMLRTSRLIYNDSVNKLNREVRMLPVSIIARMLGFSIRNYLEEQVVMQ